MVKGTSVLSSNDSTPKASASPPVSAPDDLSAANEFEELMATPRDAGAESARAGTAASDSLESALNGERLSPAQRKDILTDPDKLQQLKEVTGIEINDTMTLPEKVKALDTLQGRDAAPVEGQLEQNQPPATENTKTLPKKVKEIDALRDRSASEPIYYHADSGLVDNEYAYAVDTETKTLLDGIAKRLGIKIQLIDPTGAEGDDGRYHDGVIEISSDAEDPVLVVAKHEITHRLKETAPETYQAYERYVLDTMAKNGTDVERELAIKRSFYASRNINLDDAGVREEFVAAYTKKLLTDKDEIKRFIAADRTMAQKIFDAIRDFIRKIKTALSGKKANQKSKNETGLTLSQLQNAERLWVEAFKAGETKPFQTKNAGIEHMEPKFSVSPDFYEQFDSWDKQERNGDFLLGSPGKALTEAGVFSAPIVMSKGAMLDKADKHGYDVLIFRDLPQMIDNPYLVLQSKTRPQDSYVIYGEIYDEVNRPMMAALTIHATSSELRIVDANRITSLYARQKSGGNNADQNLIDSSIILFPDTYNERTANWAASRGLQLPTGLLNSGSNTNISQNDNGVNTYSMQNEKKDSAGKIPLKGEKEHETQFINLTDSLNRKSGDQLFQPQKGAAESFSKQIDTWLKGTMKPNEPLKLGSTPVVLMELGAKNLPLVMTQETMRKVTGEKHDISTDSIKGLPHAIADPIMVFASDTVPGAFVVLTEISDKQGNDVVAAVHINKRENRLSVNRIASVYGKNKVAIFVETQAKKGNMRYIDNKKSQQWTTSRGLQLPKLVQSLVDPNNNILQKENIVNTYSMQNTKKDVQEQAQDQYSVSTETPLSKDNIPQKSENVKAEMRGEETPRDPRNGKDDISQRKGREKSEWQTGAISDDQGKLISIGDVVEDIRRSFDIPISTGNIAQHDAKGIYKNRAEAIRVKVTNDLPTISHELGHHLDNKYQFSENRHIQEAADTLPEDFARQYKPRELKGEAVAEFTRRFLLNRNMAQRDMPNFYEEFLSGLSEDDMKTLDRLAKDINAYMSADISERFGAAVLTSKEAEKRASGSRADRVSAWFEKVYTLVKDDYYPIKEVMKDEAVIHITGRKNPYVLATNSRNAAVRAQYILLKGFTDLDGNIVGKSFSEVISGLNHPSDMPIFDEYLVLKHALEWLDNTKTRYKRVFADDMLNDPAAIEKRLQEIASKHPEFETVANALYEYQRNLKQYYYVQSGGMSQSLANELDDMYPYYVPFKRNVHTKRSGKTKASFANQITPIFRAKGSGAEIISPLESIVRNTENAVKFAVRNQVAQAMADLADSIPGFGSVMERIPPDMIRKTIGLTEIRDAITERMESENMGDIAQFESILNEELGDKAVGYSPVVKVGKGIVTVLRDGKKQYYQIHDKALYDSMAALAPRQLAGFWKVSQAILTPVKMLITSKNPLFAVGNLVRDFFTAWKHSDINNFAEFVSKYVLALSEVIRGSEGYHRYLAMGGGHSSELSANRDLIKEHLRKMHHANKPAAVRFMLQLLRPVRLVSDINDKVEAVPRYMEFKETFNKTGDPHSAIYSADEITVNFKRNGRWGRLANSVIMFCNAQVEGLDRAVRSFTEATPKQRNKRIWKYMLTAILTEAIVAWWNREKDEEGYGYASNFVNNSYFLFSIGNGEFIKVPKDRELSIPSSLIGRIIDLCFGNKYAFEEFGEYLVANLIPPMLPSDFSSPDAAVHSVLSNTALGGIVDVGFNRDYKGSPVVPAMWQYTPERNQYNERTTVIAYHLGQLTGMSPLKWDHLIDNYTGILGTLNRALLPLDGDRRDWTFGAKTRFVANTTYSTDLLRRVYENSAKARDRFLTEPTANKGVEYEKTYQARNYISEYEKAVAALPMGNKRQELARKELLRQLSNWDYTFTDNDRKLASLYHDSGDEDVFITGLPSSKLKWTNNKQSYVYQMTPDEYTEYIVEYQNLLEAGKSGFFDKMGDEINRNVTPEQFAKAYKTSMSKIKSAIKKTYEAKYANKAKITK